MKNNFLLIVLSLIVSLFIYVFYRQEQTLVNELFTSFVTLEQYRYLKHIFAIYLPLHDFIVYSLPEGLWVFCITLASKQLFITIGKREINCVFIPLLFSIGLELFQLLKITKGKFDFLDIGLSILFWFIANYFVKNKLEKQNIFKPINKRSIICILSYAVVYLAHVLN